MRKIKLSKGFTLTELVIVMGLLTLVFSMGAVTLLNTYQKPAELATQNILVANLRERQADAMTNAAYYGIHFGTSSYTLFKGASYVSSDPGNFVITLDSGLEFTQNTFTNGEIIFSPLSGDITNWTTSANSLSIKNSTGQIIATLKINKYGATYE